MGRCLLAACWPHALAACLGSTHPSPTRRCLPVPPPQFYARGLFASPLITHTRGVVRPGGGLPEQARAWAWGAVAVVHSLLDWPLRNLSGAWAPACTGLPRSRRTGPACSEVRASPGNQPHPCLEFH